MNFKVKELLQLRESTTIFVIEIVFISRSLID